MKKIIFLLLIPFILPAQFQFLPITGDYTSYFSTDTTAYVEIYLSVYQGNLQSEKGDSNSYTFSFQTIAEVYQDDILFDTYSHNYEITSQDTSVLADFAQFIDIFKTELPYGEYTVNLKMIDKKSRLNGESIFDLKTIKPTNSFFLSDIELSNLITKEIDKSIYVKNNLKIIPNPSKTYDLLHPMLYFYVELHKLPFSLAETSYYEFKYWVTNEAGDTVKSAPAKKKQVRAVSMAEIGGFNIMALPRAIHFLNISAKNLQNGEVIHSRKKFFVYKPDPKRDQIAGNKLPEIASYYHDMNEEELKKEFEKAKPIANRQEVGVFKNLENGEAMRKFLTEFWKSRDEIYEVGYGVYRTNYLERAAYSDSNFGYMGKKGWKTDRGRVYLVYGIPDEYERYPNEMGSLPHVIWNYYQLEGGSQFIFADLDGFGEYQLIHSTYRLELQDPSWRRRVEKGSSSSMSVPNY